ncbi:MAG: hypothetical protein JSR21_15870 [Proteobacteria bacterium]|nr:hypothetical protein [Pseudomonadota bacterium]
MGTSTVETARPAADADTLYRRLEDRILARDQVGASATYYDLFRAGRPLTEIVGQAVKIHAPYTHVPYHERIDDGYVNFVNNDHCLLSARVTLKLATMMPGKLAGLPMAQTIWYIPTGLDIWNQKINKMPGHYARGVKFPPGEAPKPQVFWPDQEPMRLEGPLRERLDHWMMHVHRGQVIDAYRVFLGLMENPAERQEVLAELVFAGLIDLQDRALHNRSYTTGHKSFRARATVELGNALGWDRAHDVVYAGALDIAVGPRWYSTYEMASNAVKTLIEGEALHAVPYRGASDREMALLGNTGTLSAEEEQALLHTLIREPEPAFIDAVVNLLLAGKSPRRILDAIQVGAAQVILETQNTLNFSLPQHCAEYCNTMAWFFDNFAHKQRIKLLLTAAAYLNRAAWHQKFTGDLDPVTIRAPAAAAGLGAERILDRVQEAILALDGPNGVAWAQAYLDTGADTAPLVYRVALAATRLGNDPHNQELASCLLEDYAKNRSPGRDRLLLAAVQHTAVHRKYGDPLEASRRFGEALDVAELR